MDNTSSSYHLADSHLHCYARFKWTLTEKQPVIKAYDEQLWAELPDAKIAPIEMSLLLLKAIHFKLVIVLKHLSIDNLNKFFSAPLSLIRASGRFFWIANYFLLIFSLLLIFRYIPKKRNLLISHILCQFVDRY